MPEIDRAAVSFSQTTARNFSKRLSDVYYEALKFIDEWEAKKLDVLLQLPENWKTTPDVYGLPTDSVDGILTVGDLARRYRIALWIKTASEAEQRYMIKECLKDKDR